MGDGGEKREIFGEMQARAELENIYIFIYQKPEKLSDSAEPVYRKLLLFYFFFLKSGLLDSWKASTQFIMTEGEKMSLEL